MDTPAKPVVLVTGAAGLIGSKSLWRLRHDYQPVGLDMKVLTTAPPEAECIGVDLTDDASTGLALDRVAHAYGKRIASVVHLAAYYQFSDERSPMYDKVTVGGSKRLITMLQQKGFTVEQFAFSSTMLVHKPTEPGQPITEDDPLDAKWPYPQSKIDTEQMLREVHGDIPLVLVRIAGVYDDHGQAPMITHQIKRIDQKELKSHVYSGDTDRGQSYVHLDDLIEALAKVVEHRAELDPVEPLLIGEPEVVPYQQMQDVIGQEIHGKAQWQTIQVPQPVAKAGAWAEQHNPVGDEPFIKPFMIKLANDHYELDICRAQRKLGWTPKHRLIDTVPKMVAAMKQDREGWYKAHDMEP